jgi:hypothetical protein
MGSLDSLGGKLHLAAKLVQKKKDYSHSNSLRAPLLKGQTKNWRHSPFQQCCRAIRSAMGLLLSLTRHHFQNNACIKNLPASKINPKEAKQIKTKYLVK